MVVRQTLRRLGVACPNQARQTAANGKHFASARETVAPPRAPAFKLFVPELWFWICGFNVEKWTYNVAARASESVYAVYLQNPLPLDETRQQRGRRLR
jgi:hypothetical protein